MPSHENNDLSIHEPKEPPSDPTSIAPTVTTALIHVHGIGQQERFHESSRITDALKKWWELNLPEYAFNFDVKYETSCIKNHSEDITYFEIKVNHAKQQHIIHMYEVYWAPLAGRGPSDFSILLWIMSLVFIPIKRILSNWNQYHYIRSSNLQHMQREKITVKGRQVSKSETQQLLQAYSFFENSENHNYGVHFNDFIKYIQEKGHKDTDRLINIAHAWRKRYIIGEMGVFSISIGICLGLLGAILAAIIFINTALQPLNISWLKSLPEATPLLGIISALLTLIYILFIRRYVREWIGDVKIWVTYQETANNYEIREKILNQAERVFSHIIQKHTGFNERVIVLGHSLGSTIAYETLLSLAKKQFTNNTSKLQMNKISHFFTYGSPIDKIHYFFEARSMRENTKSNVLRQLREKPVDYLLNNSDCKLEWFNFHDHGDAIGGPLETPRLPSQMSPIQNVYTPNAYFPTIVTNHAEYTNNNHMLTYLWHALVPSLKTAKIQQPCEMERADVNKHLSLMYTGQLAMLTMLYASGLGMICFFLENMLKYSPPIAIRLPHLFWTYIFLAIGLAAFIVCIAGFIFSFIKKHPDPISDRPSKFSVSSKPSL